VIVNAQDIGVTRLCAAAGCENDAEHGWAICRWCEQRRARGARIVLHEVIQPRVPDTTLELWCTSCQEWLEDAVFPLCTAERTRRGRHKECRSCQARRRREARLRMTPEQARQARAHDRAYRRSRKPQRPPLTPCNGYSQRDDRPCRNYAQPGETHCTKHLYQAHLQALLEAKEGR
jgi:hypothetical protein